MIVNWFGVFAGIWQIFMNVINKLSDRLTFKEVEINFWSKNAFFIDL